MLRILTLSIFALVSDRMKRKIYHQAILAIRISRFLTGGELDYELRDHNRRKKMYDDLRWIDVIEGYDALFHD